jgi:predicted nucleotidyltransferase
MDNGHYRRHWEVAAAREAALDESRRAAALQEARRVAERLARDYQVDRIVLFGSILNEGEFHQHSDIDLAVSGLDGEDFYRALGTLTMESRFEIDLKPLDELAGPFRRNAEQGMVLYEKGKNS